ncbi:MAG: alpha/beta hydrolase [Crocinitomicaceae bacterium]|nr:alpha/beta hydrolase [Crocinitomicaceae bacterium]
MKLFCLSGLGVDHRAFQNLQIEGVELVHIPWIDPLKNESLADYAKRLFESESIPNEYNLIGVSFGGMIAQEFEKIRKPKNLFLVSTISHSSELSGLFKFGGKLKFHKIIPGFLLTRTNWLTNSLFGVKKKKDKELFREILRDSDIPFFRWAMGAIVKWNNTSSSKGIKLHGGKDRVLPQKGSADFTIPSAGHFMIVTHGEELSGYLESSLYKE